MKKLLYAVAGLSVMVQAQTPPAQSAPLGLQHVTFVAKLLSPISTKTSREGDTFTAVVEQPPAYQDAVLEGKINKLKKPKRGVGQGKAEISFQFDAMTVKSRRALVSVDLKDVQNSKGVKAVDEEGHVIGRTSNKKRALTALALGAAGAGIGAAAGGSSGAAKGGVIGLAAGAALALTMTTAASDMEFLPGSHFVLDVSDRR